MKWRPLDIPYICERMIGFSVPHDDTVLVVSYEGMHLIRLAEPATIETDTRYAEYDLYVPEAGTCTFRGHDWEIIGLFPGRPILDAPGGERLVLDAAGESISVVKRGDVTWSSPYQNFSGDWAAATFSPDGRHIVLGCPYDFDFRVWKRTTGSDNHRLAGV